MQYIYKNYIKMKQTQIFLEGFLQGFRNFGHKITSIVNFILLFFAYFIGVGVTWLFAKILGKRFLDIKKERRDSYWIKDKIGKRKIEDYYRSF